ncbi:glycosyltransferase [Cellulomonas endophytica]|uniref:glycosyltransferase n=1 Tax=Cellulomonas endophytica TaxID=2494735 RepID=UPI0010138901|nr:glycosyltransferase [Cellulomonas endophytica]
MTRAVLVTKQVPWPSTSGAALRESNVAAMLGTVVDDVHVVGFGAQPDQALVPEGVTVHAFEGSDDVRGTLAAGSLVIGRWFSAAMARRVASLLTPGTHLHVGFPHMAVAVPAVSRIDSLDLHNVESDLLAQRAARRDPVQRRLLAAEVWRMRAWERRLGAEVPIVSCVSENDRRRLLALGVDALVAPNGAVLPAEPTPPSGDTVAFVGSLDWEPNEEGVLWFARQVWPHLRAARPATRVTVAGRSPGPALTGLHVDGVDVRGDVPAVGPVYTGSALAICPLLTGGGSRLKIVEALAHGRPVVSTRLGAEGMEDLWGHGVVVADDPREFAGTVARLLADPAELARLSAEGRAAVARSWSWEATLRPLRDRIVQKIERGAGR